jgi:hypothetical protein
MAETDGCGKRTPKTSSGQGLGLSWYYTCTYTTGQRCIDLKIEKLIVHLTLCCNLASLLTCAPDPYGDSYGKNSNPEKRSKRAQL